MTNSTELNGDIELIYQRHYLDVYKFLICFVGNRNEAEDLTQEVFIRVLKNSSNFNYQSKLSTWILSIAKHTAIDHLRRKKLFLYSKKVPDTSRKSSVFVEWERGDG